TADLRRSSASPGARRALSPLVGGYRGGQATGHVLPTTISHHCAAMPRRGATSGRSGRAGVGGGGSHRLIRAPSGNQPWAGAWIEFAPDGCTKVTITISRQLVDQARTLDLMTLDLSVEAPRAFGVPHPIPLRLY